MSNGWRTSKQLSAPFAVTWLGGGVDDDLVFDAVRVRLIEIGEAVKSLPDDLLASEPDIPWRQVAGMRDRLAHRYFDASRQIVRNTVEGDLPELERAIQRMRLRTKTD